MKNTNVPAIRFKGFDDDWEQRKFSELCDMVTVGIANSATHAYSDSGIVMFRNQNIKPNFLDDNDIIHIKPEFESRYKNKRLKKNDLLVARTGYPGTACVVPEKYENSQTFTTLIARPKNSVNPYFLCQYLNSDIGVKYFESTQIGGGQKNSGAGILNEMPVMLPSGIEEESKIAEYFTNFDHLITLHQRKLEKIKIMRKSMLEKIFPQNDKNSPKIRFDGYTDDWEQRKLGDIYGSIGNAFVGTATPYYAEQGHFYLESNNVKDGQINHNSEVFINDEFYEKQKDKWLHTGDMVMVQSGHVGHAAVIPEELDNTAAHALIMFRNPKEEIEPYFLNYEYQTDKSKKKIENITTGNTIKHILASDMQEFIVDVPKYEEQKVIACYFRNIDYLITLHQRKLEKLKKAKKSMLEQMFPIEK